MTKRTLLKAALGSMWTVALAVAAADYAWWSGFNDGADTSLCAMASFVDGKKALQQDWCHNIQNRKPPVDLFRLKRP